MTGLLGELLSNMDQSVQVELIEQAAEEKRLFSEKRRMTLFRKLSQRMSFLSTNKSSSKSLAGNSSYIPPIRDGANTTIIEDDKNSNFRVSFS